MYCFPFFILLSILYNAFNYLYLVILTQLLNFQTLTVVSVSEPAALSIRTSSSQYQNQQLSVSEPAALSIRTSSVTKQ